MPKLTGMSTPGYNGLACDIVCTKSPLCADKCCFMEKMQDGVLRAHG